MTTRTLSTRHLLTWFVAVLAAVAALAGATVGYQLMSDPGRAAAVAPARTPATDAAPHRAATRPVVLKLRPCPRGFDRHGAACVRTVQRTRVVHEAAPVPAPAPAPAPAPPPAVPAGSIGSSDDGVAHDAGDDHGGGAAGAFAGDDHGDDHGHDDGEDRADDHGGADDAHEPGDDHGSDDGFEGD